MRGIERACSLIIMALGSANVGVAFDSASIAVAAFGLLVPFAYWVEVIKR